MARDDYDDDDDDLDEEEVLKDSPVLPPMRSQGRDVDVAVDDKGHLWVVYNKPFDDIVNWLEYDDDDGSLTLVLKNGKTQDLGNKIAKSMRKGIRRSKMAMFALMNMNDESIVEMFPVTVVVRRAGI